MRQPLSLKARIAAWFAGIFFLLYVAAAVGVIAIEARSSRQQLSFLLYAEAEGLAGYYAASGRLDFPELLAPDPDTPAPVWVRLVEGDRVLAATPGMPALPLPGHGAPEGVEVALEIPDVGGFISVRHPVWSRPEVQAEAVAPWRPHSEHTRNLLTALGLTGLLLGPLVALGGWVLAQRGLRPVEGLIASIRALDSSRLSERVEANGAAREIQALAREFNALQERLRGTVERMRRFTADASHELRTPISILRTSIEVALRRRRPVEEDRELMRDCLVEIKRIQRIVEGLLSLARDETGKGEPLRFEAVDLSALVGSTVEAVRATAEEKGLALGTQLAQGLTVHGDEDRLRLMVLNLLDNALRYTPPRRAVQVSLEEAAGQARLQVADEGEGVAPEDRPHLFERFYRGAAARSSGAVSGGLGLALVRWVAEDHGGAAELVETPGPGATFRVRLPLLGAGAAAPDSPIVHAALQR